MPRKTPFAQLLLFLLAAFIVVGLSVGLTLHLSGVPVSAASWKVSEALGYRHATLTDARMECEKEMLRRFPGRIRVMHVDSLSSRLDYEADQYKVFIEAEIFPDSDRAAPPRQYFIGCYASTDRAKVTQFQFAGDSPESLAPDGGEESNYFGL